MFFNFSKFKVTINILSLGALFAVAGCKRDNTSRVQPSDATNPRPVSIVRIETYGTANISFAYNKDSTLQSISAAGYEFGPNLLFSYKPNMFLIEARLPSYNNNAVFYRDSVSLNASGRIVNVRHFNADKTAWHNENYTLNGNNEVIQLEDGVSTSQKTGKHPYAYVNGNVIRDATAAVYLYDLSKPAQFGDHHSIQQFLTYGLTYNMSKNLVTGAVYGKDTMFYKYKFDKAGRIIASDVEQQGKIYSQYKIVY